jgi:GntR family transcriptional regulator
VAAELQLNPITVSKSYQALVDEGLVEKRRGLGMFVCEGARKQLIASERNKFLKEEWPATLNRIEQLGLDAENLLAELANQDSSDAKSK